MRVLLVLILSVLAGCSGGSVSNPFGSFGSGPARGAPDGTRSSAVVDDGRELVAALQSVVPEAALRGVILRVTAINRTQGYHSTIIVPLNNGLQDDAGIVSFEVRAVPPEFTEPQGPEVARRVVAAIFVNDNQLEDIRGFRLISAGNTINLRR